MSRFSFRARLGAAGAGQGVPAVPDVVFYSGFNYTGAAYPAAIGTGLPTFAEANDAIRSIRLNSPAKVYVYTDTDYDNTILVTSSSIPDLTPYTSFGTWPFAYSVRSARVEAASYVQPSVTAPAAFGLRDGSTMPLVPGNQLFSNVPMTTPTLVNNDQTSHDIFVGGIALTPDIPTLFSLAARDACAVLYAAADEAPIAHKSFTVKFDIHSNPDVAATASYGTSTVTIYHAAQSYVDFGLASWLLLHELSHIYSKVCMRYHESSDIAALEEGLADYVCMKAGVVKYSPRPADGGGYWDEGYLTTAYFYDYIEREVDPQFVRKLVASFTTTDLTLKVAPWTIAEIPRLNVPGKTLDELWADYKAWVAAQPAPRMSARTATAAPSFQRPLCGLSLTN